MVFIKEKGLSYAQSVLNNPGSEVCETGTVPGERTREAILLLVVFTSLAMLGCDADADSRNQVVTTFAESSTAADASRNSVPGELIGGAEGDSESEAAITPETVYLHEEDWPNIVAMTASHTTDGGRTLQPGYRGSLVRVDPEGRPRIDFGRHGKHVVPAELTDLVVAANEVRRGVRHKTAPNFFLQLGTRLIDSTSEKLVPLPSALLESAPAFLVLFAEVSAPEFPSVAAKIKSLEGDSGLKTILIPQSAEREDILAIKEQLQFLDWPVPFVYPNLSEDYTSSLLSVPPRGPRVLLVTPNGRVLLDSDADVGELGAKIRRVFPATSAHGL